MTLKVNHIRRRISVTAPEKMIERNLIKRGAGGISGNMSADAVMDSVGLNHHRHGVPADIALDAPLYFPVSGIGRLFLYRDGVDIGSADRRGYFEPRFAQPRDQALQDKG